MDHGKSEDTFHRMEQIIVLLYKLFPNTSPLVACTMDICLSFSIDNLNMHCDHSPQSHVILKRSCESDNNL